MDVVSAIKAELDKPKNVKKKFINKVVVRDDTLTLPGVTTLIDLCVGYPHIKNVHFYRCRIGDEGVRLLAALLRVSCDPWGKNCSQLKRIDITDDQAGKPLPQPTHWGDDDGDNTLAGDGIIVSSSGLPETMYTPIGVGGISSLASALSLPGLTLRVLVMDHNPLSEASVYRLSMGIRRCKTLSTLSLQGCGITSASAFALGTIVMQPPTPEGVVESAADAQRPKLTNLNLSGNPLGVEGAAILADAMSQNNSITHLSLSDISLPLEPESDLAYEAFAQMMLRNDTLKIIDLGRNPITSQQFAQHLLPAITVKPNVAYVKVMHTLDRALVKQYLLTIKGRGKKKKRGRRKGGKKK